jgi:poly(hydroxyalkanoate) granule-associated protein
MVMPKKLTDLVNDPPESQLAATVRESASQIWLAGLGAFATAQREGLKVFEGLVAEGEKFQEKAKLATDERVAEVRSKATGAWDKLEHVFEERVARALHSLSVPTRKDIDQLSKRVAELTVIAKKLSGELEAAEAAEEVAGEPESEENKAHKRARKSAAE